MINLLLLLVFLSCLGITAAWVAENPGDVTIHWFDYQVDTSFAFLLAIALACVAVLTCSVLLFRWLALAPMRHREWRGVRHYRKGLSELTYSVASLAASDIKQAESHMRKAEHSLGPTPLTLLLSAQISRSRGDDTSTRLLLTKMLEHKETEYLAARSLSDAAARQQALPAALAMAQRAEAINPNNGIVPLVSLQLRLGRWQEAQIALHKALRRGHLTRNQFRRYRGLLHLQHGMKLLESGQHEAAHAVARASLKDAQGFTPAVIFSARAMAANNQLGKALRLVKQAWKKSPHPHLAELMRELIASYPKEKRAKLMEKFTALHPHAINDTGTWLCADCGHSTTQWDAHCPACGGFDTLEWK